MSWVKAFFAVMLFLAAGSMGQFTYEWMVSKGMPPFVWLIVALPIMVYAVQRWLR